MLNFLSAIVDFIFAIAGFVLNIIRGIISVMLLIPQSIAFITYTVGYMPADIVIFITAGVSLCVVLFIIGR